MKTISHRGQPCWAFGSDHVEALITRSGHLAPVRFRLGRQIVEPFSIAPWGEEKFRPALPSLLQGLRGDFFCAPFGGNATPYRGERHPAHGESANGPWRFRALDRDQERTRLHLSLRTRARAGRIDKFIELRRGETAVYCRHRLSGMKGPMNLGHHAMLKFPAAPGAGRISTSGILLGQVFPDAFENPAQGGYSSLKPGAFFQRLDRVPKMDGTHADLSRYPARAGFEDLVLIVHEARPDFAWTAVTFPAEGYAWVALKDPRVLRSTVFWISNRGRHYAPWNGRHGEVMGLEEVTSYFHTGLAESARPNPVSRRGFPTVLQLRPDAPLTVNYIMAVAAIPRGFQRVESIAAGPDGVTLVSPSKQRAQLRLDTGFLHEDP